MASRSITVEIIGDTTSLEKAFGRAGVQSQTFGQKVQKGAGVAALALGGGLLLAAKAGFDELSQGQKVAAQTEAVLKSTGGAANVTAGQVGKLADAISKKSGIDDEAIQSGENLLLTFKNVTNEVGKGNDVFNRATQSAIDLSVAGFGSIESASKMMGKALNDPIKGISALGRAGVTFSEDQKKAIAEMVKTGDVLGAQKIILKEVESQVGGSAAAYGETLPGQLNKAKNAFANLAGSLVQVLLPAVLAITGVLAPLAGFLQEHETVAKALAGVLVGLAAVLGTISVATKLWAAGTAVATAAQWLLNAALTANPIGVVVVAIAALAAGLILAYKKSETFREIVEKALEAVSKAFDVVKDAAQTFIGFFTNKIPDAFDDVRDKVADFAGFFTQTLPNAFKKVLDWVRSNWPIIATLLSGPFAPIVALATNAFGIRDALVGAFGSIKDWVRGNWPEIATLLSGPFAPIVALATNSFGIRDALLGALDSMKTEALGKITDLVTGIAGKAGEFLTAATTLGTNILNGVIAGIGDIAGKVAAKITGAVQAVTDKFDDALKAATSFGAKILDGALAGLLGIGTKVAGKVESAVQAVRDKFDDATKAATNLGGKILSGILDGLTGIYADIKAKVRGGIDAVQDLIGVAFNHALKVGQNIAKGVLEGIGNLATLVYNKVRNAVNDVISKINNIRIPGFSVHISLPGPVPDIDFSVGSFDPIPDIPYLAKGGIVRRPTLAILGERGPEAVIPLNGRSGTGGNTYTFNFPNYVGDKRELAEMLRAELIRVGRRNPGVLGGLA